MRTSPSRRRPSFLASVGLHDREAVIVIVIVALVVAAHDRGPCSRADGICDRSSFALQVSNG